jgi:hypothetical protein
MRAGAALLSLLVVLGGCGFAQKHPGVTIGIVTGTIGWGACELAVEKIGTCAAIGGAAGLVFGGITGLVTMFADTSAHELPNDEDETTRAPTGTPPPPGLPVDAGVPEQPVSPVPLVTPSVIDAGIAQSDAGL